MTAPRILAIDQGTTSSRALVVDHEGRVLGAGQRATPVRYPRPGWVDQDAEALWQATEAAIAIALGSAQVAPGEITAIGIANQRETVVAWDRGTGEPSAPAIGWQDRRTLDHCAELEAAGHGPGVRAATGLTIDPYFSATKIAWLLDNVPDLRRRAAAGDIAVGTVDSWLAWKLTGGARHVTDYTNASRTLLFNTGRGRWDAELCNLFGIPREILPLPQPSASPFGRTSTAAFGAEVPILAIAGDQQAALYGQACFQPGMAKNTYGTGCFLLANAGRRSAASTNGLLVSLGPGTSTSGPEYVIEGSVFVAGAGISWLQEQLGLNTGAEIEALARSVPASDGVEFVPAFAGLGAPHWDPAAKGAIVGLSLGTTRAHIARAAL
ncbi:MAG TPA: FGGY family carbohydrate kinase, partial [Tepidiformaceae bacterium]|nr:FGGY family carbohydrate kinase [Tepidiformaceae bacterium]